MEKSLMRKMLHGMILHANVKGTLVRILPLCEPAMIAVIRSIDSSHSETDLSQVLRFHGVLHEVINRNVCVSPSSLRHALAAEVFTGFDEVWLLPGEPPHIGLDVLPGATSDAADFAQHVPAELLDAMEKTNCFLIMGDGCGLNYITSGERIAELIRTIAS
jgi:hypothetical protein